MTKDKTISYLNSAIAELEKVIQEFTQWEHNTKVTIPEIGHSVYKNVLPILELTKNYIGKVIRLYINSDITNMSLKSTLYIAICLLNEKEEILLLNDSKSGRWTFPIWRQKLFETSDETFVREMQDSFGVTAIGYSSYRDLCVSPKYPHGKNSQLLVKIIEKPIYIFSIINKQLDKYQAMAYFNEKEIEFLFRNGELAPLVSLYYRFM